MSILRLQHTRPDGEVDTFHLKSVRRYHIGRGSQCEIRILDMKMSRKHCAIERQGTEWLLHDLGSTNGAQVDGRKLARGSSVILTVGSVIDVGSTTMTIAGIDDGPTAARSGEQVPIDDVAEPTPVYQEALPDTMDEDEIPAPEASNAWDGEPEEDADDHEAALETARSKDDSGPHEFSPADAPDTLLGDDAGELSTDQMPMTATQPPSSKRVRNTGESVEPIAHDDLYEDEPDGSSPAENLYTSDDSSIAPVLTDDLPDGLDETEDDDDDDDPFGLDDCDEPDEQAHGGTAEIDSLELAADEFEPEPDEEPAPAPAASAPEPKGESARPRRSGVKPITIRIGKDGEQAESAPAAEEAKIFINVLGRKIGPLTKDSARELKARELKGTLTEADLAEYPSA